MRPAPVGQYPSGLSPRHREYDDLAFGLDHAHPATVDIDDDARIERRAVPPGLVVLEDVRLAGAHRRGEPLAGQSVAQRATGDVRVACRVPGRRVTCRVSSHAAMMTGHGCGRWAP